MWYLTMMTFGYSSIVVIYMFVESLAIRGHDDMQWSPNGNMDLPNLEAMVRASTSMYGCLHY